MFNLKSKKNKKKELDPIDVILRNQSDITEIIKGHNEAIKTLQECVLKLQEQVRNNEKELEAE